MRRLPPGLVASQVIAFGALLTIVFWVLPNYGTATFIAAFVAAVLFACILGFVGAWFDDTRGY